jgi:hypothetical protein
MHRPNFVFCPRCRLNNVCDVIETLDHLTLRRIITLSLWRSTPIAHWTVRPNEITLTEYLSVNFAVVSIDGIVRRLPQVLPHKLLCYTRNLFSVHHICKHVIGGVLRLAQQKINVPSALSAGHNKERQKSSGRMDCSVLAKSCMFQKPTPVPLMLGHHIA